MEKLQEILKTEVKILSEKKAKGGDTMVVTVPFVQAGEKNSNGRTYPLALLKREVSRIQDAVKRHQLIGTGDHPAGGFSDIRTASHILQKVWLDDKGQGFATMKIIPTERGKAIQTLINHDAELGVSSRGFGSVDGKTGVVQNDYKLAGIDIVMHPSYKEGTFNKDDVYESVEFEEENLDKMMGINPDFVEAMVKSVYGMRVDEGGFEGSLEDFKKQKGNLVRAEILVSYDKFEAVEEALKHLGDDKEARRISSAPVPPVQKRVTEDSVFLEARMAGVSPKIYADKLNANLDRQEKMESDSDFTVEETASILEEARKSGINITDPEERKRILEIARKQKTQKVLTENEKAEIVAKKFGSTPEHVKEIWAFERKRKEKERKKAGKIDLLVKEGIAAGFGQEIRSSVRKISKKIIEGE